MKSFKFVAAHFFSMATEHGIMKLSPAELEQGFALKHSAVPSKAGKLVTHHFSFYLKGAGTGEAKFFVYPGKKQVFWNEFYPSGRESGGTKGSGFGTLAHVAALRKLAEGRPEISAYLVKHVDVKPGRKAQLERMGLARAMDEGMPFDEYLKKSEEYARKRFGFSL